MAAFIPSRRDRQVNETALAKVRDDKTREAGDGFDGSWVAHPDLVPVCRAVFDGVLGDRPHQLDRTREDVQVTAAQLLDVKSTPGQRTEAGLRNDISVGIQYLATWLPRTGAGGHLQPDGDAATAEISVPGVAVAAQRRHLDDTGENVGWNSSSASPMRNSRNCRVTRPDYAEARTRCSWTSPWPTSSSTSDPCPHTSVCPDPTTPRREVGDDHDGHP
jgi:malate synthase